MTERRIIGTQPWHESLFGCTSDLSSCCFGCCCPCCLFGENAHGASKDTGCLGSCFGYLVCCCIMHRIHRKRFREAYALEEGKGCANDFCASCCFSWCAICQEARERKVQGPPPMITIVSHASVLPNSSIDPQLNNRTVASGLTTSQN